MRKLPKPRTIAALAMVSLIASCASRFAFYDPSKPHRQGDRFANNYSDFEPGGLARLIKWRIAAAREGLPKPPAAATPQVAPELAFLRANTGAGQQPSITWIGHASVLAQLGGLTLLTDPMFSERASPLSFIGPRRAQPPGIALADLPHVDVVLISHNHYDHLDEASVRALSRQSGGSPLFIVPLGLKAWLADVGVMRAVELDWWQTQRVGDVEIVLTPVQHWSGRGLTDRMQTLWGGFAVFAADCHLFFAGDTGYSQDFADIRAHFAARQRDGGFDIALLPIGAYEPRWFMQTQHENPSEAVHVHRDLRAKRSLAVHWGSFELSDESLDQPPRALAQARREQGVADDAFFVVAIGETRRLPRR
jgi:N-acyl-phosphatidylethanolamine-hydrolysing phospholipase D